MSRGYSTDQTIEIDRPDSVDVTDKRAGRNSTATKVTRQFFRARISPFHLLTQGGGGRKAVDASEHITDPRCAAYGESQFGNKRRR
jgi:hypothetical protein